jgi:hypothetical protein
MDDGWASRFQRELPLVVVTPVPLFQGEAVTEIEEIKAVIEVTQDTMAAMVEAMSIMNDTMRSLHDRVTRLESHTHDIEVHDHTS